MPRAVDDAAAPCREALEQCKARGHGWKAANPDDFSIMQNLLCQLNSIREVNELWKAAHAHAPYEAVIFARPDVLFNCPFPVQFLTDLQVCCPARRAHARSSGCWCTATFHCLPC